MRFSLFLQGASASCKNLEISLLHPIYILQRVVRGRASQSAPLLEASDYEQGGDYPYTKYLSISQLRDRHLSVERDAGCFEICIYGRSLGRLAARPSNHLSLSDDRKKIRIVDVDVNRQLRRLVRTWSRQIRHQRSSGASSVYPLQVSATDLLATSQSGIRLVVVGGEVFLHSPDPERDQSIIFCRTPTQHSRATSEFLLEIYERLASSF